MTKEEIKPEGLSENIYGWMELTEVLIKICQLHSLIQLINTHLPTD